MNNRSPKNCILMNIGMIIFALGIVGGLSIAVIYGTDSQEFKNIFGYFIAMYGLASLLYFLVNKKCLTSQLHSDSLRCHSAFLVALL